MARSTGSHHPYPRSARVNKILREVISDELVRISDVDERMGLLTVTGVDTSPDMRHAMVYFDSLSDAAKAALEERRGQIQGAVNAQTRLKRTPKLSFMADPAVASGTIVEELLRRQRHDDD
jgi:ribosome-binding factor A